MTFYTYMWLRGDATPYYVGKGTGKRAFQRRDHGVHRPVADARILVQHWASEAEAFEMEKYYIRLFGRKDNGTGILKNLTNGGEGMSGYVYTPALRAVRRKQLLTRPLGTSVSCTKGGKLQGSIQGQKNVNSGLLHRLRLTTQGGKAASHVRWHIKRGVTQPTCSFCSIGVINA